MALRRVNKELLQQIEIDRKNISKGSMSSAHVMSKEDFLSIYEHLFKLYDSIQITYNINIPNEEEQVVIIIGIFSLV